MEEVRKAGAVPAYISIMQGKIKVGMSDDELDDYGKRRGTMAKASRREIPLILAKGEYGIMTLAATMVVADIVNIPVVSGGGMGGVHRGAEYTMDISSDLEGLCDDIYMIDNGATGTWEDWKDARSHFHNCYNGIASWFYQALGGILPTQPGYRHVAIYPQTPQGVSWVEVTEETPYGTLRVSWRRHRRHLRIRVTIPVGITAHIYGHTYTNGTHTIKMF
mgnify:CR=1 FL=1